MSKLILQISKPAKGDIVGKSIGVTGVLRVDTSLPAGGMWPAITVQKLEVRFGPGGDARTATRSGTAWTTTGSASPNVVGGSALTITAVASGTKTPNDGTAKDPEPGTPVPFTQTTSVAVTLEDHVLETLTISPFTSPVTPDKLPYELLLTGTAGDVSGIKSVEVSLDGGPFEGALLVPAHDVSVWRRQLTLTQGRHPFTVRATDSRSNARTVAAAISVELPFEPGDVEQVFEPTRYLLELLDFATRYVDVGDPAAPLTPALLTKRFHQPFDRLTRSRFFEQATRALPQPRVAVEVLRGHLKPPAPAELDQRFRAQAYRTLLLNVGATYDELRLARTADQRSRQALAIRLGVGTLGERPDCLDELTLSPDAISGEQLENLFGYASTSPTDPLSGPVETADVLLWQRAALAAQWQQEDAAERDGAGEALPIVDPDLVDRSSLAGSDPNDPAFSLWTARRSWIDGKLDAITQEAKAVADPAVRFKRLVASHLGKLDIPGLAARDANGEDIEPDLLPFKLDLEAFRFLARARAALARGLLLDTEWEDVFSILVQVEKRRQYRPWRLEERQVSLVLQPSSFTLVPAPTETVSPWRAPRALAAGWLRTLAARIAQADALEARYALAVAETEVQVLPALRDALIAELGRRHKPQPEPLETAAERLTRELLVDLRSSSGEQTTRVEQALETLQAVLFSARAGRLAADGPGQKTWKVRFEVTPNLDFDAEWEWMGTYASWLAAMRVFAYPENQLLPTLYVGPDLDPPPTKAFAALIAALRKETRLTAETARAAARSYLDQLRTELGAALDKALQKPWELTDERTDEELVALQTTNATFNPVRQHHRELFWLVPVVLAQKLQESRQFQAALDWYRTVYAFHLPPENRRIYRGLQLEDAIISNYGRVPEWLMRQLNPHVFAGQRRNCYTRSTIMSIVSCFLAFGDAEFAQSSVETNARARTLYETAADLLDLPEAQPETGPKVPFPENPVLAALREQSGAGSSKIHRGLNIAGAIIPGFQEKDGGQTTLPSQYRYAILVERAKSLVGIAQQLEAAFLAALEQRDAQTYDAMQADQDLQVARATLTIQDIKVADAQTGVRLAGLQRERAELQEDYFSEQLRGGLSVYEQAGLAGLGAAAYLQSAAGALGIANTAAESAKAAATFGLFGDPLGSAAQALSSLAAAASTGAQIAQTIASYERREQEWRLQRSLAGTDVEIGEQQIQLAQDQLLLARRERALAGVQFDHARAVANFLATKFTNAELFEWMSGVLGRVYAYFLQQATALAQLAEAQLAFERQEPIAGFVKPDYWHDTTGENSAAANDGADRRGLTGSARLLQDIFRLDGYAFETDRRKLHLTQTLSLAQLAAVELQQFRETGILTFATPETLFDREFPGHYLRLIKRVSVSLIALIPPTRGVRATLSASGVSRVVVTRGRFDTATIRREPESIAFTSAINATGMFALESESAMLLPFEGMGVDTVWQLELPKAANPFDYRSIADVLLTIEYTALGSEEYRQTVIRCLGTSFAGDRSFSLRNQFPDVWYELNNADTLDGSLPMRASLTLTDDDFPPHIQDLAIAQLTLFVVRDETLVDELSVAGLQHTTPDGETIEAGAVRTIDGIVSTRRPGGAGWQGLTGADPVGSWELQLEDSPQTRHWFSEGLIDDLVLVFSLTGASPSW